MTQISTVKEEAQSVKIFLEREDTLARIIGAYQNEKKARNAISAVMVEVSKSDDLQKCSRASILQSVLDAANYGLIPNKLSGHAYLIPYKGVCTLQIGYKGYIDKFDAEGWTVECEAVTKKEIALGHFKELRGTKTEIIHMPIRDELQTEETVSLCYAIAKKKGRKPIICVMSLSTIMEAAKSQVGWDKAAGKKIMGLKGVWKSEDRETDFIEQCKKTVIRRLAKHCPIRTVNEMSSYEAERDEMIDITPVTKSTQDSIMDQLKDKPEPEVKGLNNSTEETVNLYVKKPKQKEEELVSNEKAQGADKKEKQSSKPVEKEEVKFVDAEYEEVESENPEPKEIDDSFPADRKDPKPEPVVGIDLNNIALKVKGKVLPKRYVSVDHAYSGFKLFLMKEETPQARQTLINDNKDLVDIFYVEQVGSKAKIASIVEKGE